MELNFGLTRSISFDDKGVVAFFDGKLLGNGIALNHARQLISVGWFNGHRIFASGSTWLACVTVA